jgi:hypothetical protein
MFQKKALLSEKMLALCRLFAAEALPVGQDMGVEAVTLMVLPCIGLG